MNHREKTHSEMEAAVGRSLHPGEKVVFLPNPCDGKLTEWHLILGIWTRMQ